MVAIRNGLRELQKNISHRRKIVDCSMKDNILEKSKGLNPGIFELSTLMRWKCDSKVFLSFPVPQHHNKQNKERRKEMCCLFLCLWLRNTSMN